MSLIKLPIYLGKSVDAVQFLNLVPGALLASDLTKRCDVVALKAEHELEEDKPTVSYFHFGYDETVLNSRPRKYMGLLHK